MEDLAVWLGTLEYYAVIGGWLLFAALFLVRKRPPRAQERSRDRRSLVAMLLQGLGYAIVWSFRRPPASGFLRLGPTVEIALAVLGIILMGGSLWLTYAAIRALGKQWSLAARVVEKHQLVTVGPYGLVRHPIYSGMLGMLLATGLAVGRWPGLAVGAAVYLLGTAFRLRVEEQLLRQAFGREYDDYARKVPALVPRWPGA